MTVSSAAKIIIEACLLNSNIPCFASDVCDKKFDVAVGYMDIATA